MYSFEKYMYLPIPFLDVVLLQIRVTPNEGKYYKNSLYRKNNFITFTSSLSIKSSE